MCISSPVVRRHPHRLSSLVPLNMPLDVNFFNQVIPPVVGACADRAFEGGTRRDGIHMRSQEIPANRVPVRRLPAFPTLWPRLALPSEATLLFSDPTKPDFSVVQVHIQYACIHHPTKSADVLSRLPFRHIQGKLVKSPIFYKLGLLEINFHHILSFLSLLYLYNNTMVAQIQKPAP